MLKIATLAVAVAVIFASLDEDWAAYKNKYGKTYTGLKELLRLLVWQGSQKIIQDHNELYDKGEKSYYLADNKYSDMTSDEFNRKMNGLKLDKAPEPVCEKSGKYKGILPDTVDWRTKDYVTPVKDQGHCGACWAFAATGALEGAHKKSTGDLVSLSESNLIDCSGTWGNLGCRGGLPAHAFQYVIDNKGLDTEKSYPYKPSEGLCNFRESDVGTTAESIMLIMSGLEDELQNATSTVGPVSVGVDASSQSFQLYRGGVYDDPNCSTTNLNHAMLVVGYGSENDTDYWLVKNSWGKDWGEDGYIKMSRNKNNQCGIATLAVYPTV